MPRSSALIARGGTGGNRQVVTFAVFVNTHSAKSPTPAVTYWWRFRMQLPGLGPTRTMSGFPRLPSVSSWDLDAGDAVEDFIVRDVDVVAHADIDRRVRDLRDHVVLDHAVLAELRKDAVDAGVDDHVVADLEVVAGLPITPLPL